MFSPVLYSSELTGSFLDLSQISPETAYAGKQTTSNRLQAQHSLVCVTCVSNVDAGISKYLRHSEAVSSKHYNFGAIEESARNREVVVQLIGGPKATVDIDTASNSTVDTETDVAAMTTGELTHKLYENVLTVKPINIMDKLPTLDDVRAVINTHFTAADDLRKHTAPKRITSR